VGGKEGVDVGAGELVGILVGCCKPSVCERERTREREPQVMLYIVLYVPLIE
jgi:hypothetical protein